VPHPAAVTAGARPEISPQFNNVSRSNIAAARVHPC
jgi:hypothetical protein